MSVEPKGKYSLRLKKVMEISPGIVSQPINFHTNLKIVGLIKEITSTETIIVSTHLSKDFVSPFV